MTTLPHRRPLIAGNWKLHCTLAEAEALAQGVAAGAVDVPQVDWLIAPSFTALTAVRRVIASSAVQLAAQDVHWEPQGAFTGEVSAAQLKDVGCQSVIVGHSERRQYFGETDAGVNKKIRALLAAKLQPIVCIGETQAEREAGRSEAVVLAQLDGALQGLDANAVQQCCLAYEPVWAIGTGLSASPSDAQIMHAAIRARLGALQNGSVAQSIRILYGGSVKPGNAADLLGQTDIDGALVGGASLKAGDFLAIGQGALR
ncbi:MAG: triose-phosphate isomerase [Polyangiales bacterium]